MSNCFFAKSTSRIITIKVSDDNNKLLLEYSTFSSIQVNATGACLRFENKGQCVTSQVCAFNCSCYSYFGHFSSVEVSSIENFKNDVIESSFLSSGDVDSGWSVLRIYNGSILYDSNNISYALAHRTSMMQARSYLPEDNFVKFSNFFNCCSTDSFGISFYYGDFSISFCSFTNCSSLYALFYCEHQANATFASTIFIGNEAPTLFSKNSLSYMKITDCLLLNNTGSIQVNELQTINGDIIMNLKLLSTAFCEAENPININKLYVKQSQVLCIRDQNFLNYAVMIVMEL